MNKQEIKEKIILEIENCLNNDKTSPDDKLVFNMIALGNDHQVLDNAFLEVCFIKLFHQAMKWENNTVPCFLKLFNINQERAGVLVERYITYELHGQVQMVSSTFNIIDKALEASINNAIFFNESFLLNNFIEVNIAGYKHTELINKNKINQTTYLQKKLEQELIEKDKVNPNKINPNTHKI